jgi:hypothetical protein
MKIFAPVVLRYSESRGFVICKRQCIGKGILKQK